MVSFSRAWPVCAYDRPAKETATRSSNDYSVRRLTVPPVLRWLHSCLSCMLTFPDALIPRGVNYLDCFAAAAQLLACEVTRAPWCHESANLQRPTNYLTSMLYTSSHRLFQVTRRAVVVNRPGSYFRTHCCSLFLLVCSSSHRL